MTVKENESIQSFYHKFDNRAVLRFKLLKCISCIFFLRQVVKFQSCLRACQWSLKIVCLLVWFLGNLVQGDMVIPGICPISNKHLQKLKSFVVHTS